jgi:hypothetical protein
LGGVEITTKSISPDAIIWSASVKVLASGDIANATFNLSGFVSQTAAKDNPGVALIAMLCSSPIAP